MGSATVEAQKLANASNELIAEKTNAANKGMTQQTNEMNYKIASEANAYNRENLQLQNQWNIEQWERENAYNDPSAQVERYLKAGINPLWAMSNTNPGNAQHLESGDPLPAQVAQMVAPHADSWRVQPEYDPYVAQHIANINTAVRDMVNGFQTAADLALKKEDVDIRRAAQQSRSAFDLASAGEKRAATTGREIENSWNLSTFDVRAKSESQKLYNMTKQYDLLDANTDEARAKKLEIDEHRNLIREQTNQVIAGIIQRDRELDIMQQNANSNKEAVQVSRDRLNLEDERFSAEIEKWNNEFLLQYMYKFGRTISGEMSAKVGFEGLGVSGKAGLRETTPADVEKMISCGIKVIERYGNDPSEQNAQDAAEASRIIDALQRWQLQKQIIPVDALFNSTNSTIFNPSE